MDVKMAEKAPLASPAFTGVPTINGAGVATATTPQEYDLPLAEGLSQYGHYGVNVYWKDQFGVVHWHLNVMKSGTTDDIINGQFVFILPPGFRPAHSIVAICNQAHLGTSEAGFVTIDINGQATVLNHSAASCRNIQACGSFIAVQ